MGYKTSSYSYPSSLSVVYAFQQQSSQATHLPYQVYLLTKQLFCNAFFFQCFLKHPLIALPLHCTFPGVRRLLCRDYSDNRCPGFGSLLQGYQALVPVHASKYLRHYLCLKAAVLSPPWRSLGRLSLLCAFRDIAFLATLMFQLHAV